jgi:hypothetical protein
VPEPAVTHNVGAGRAPPTLPFSRAAYAR